jgi:hypothetical protein
MIHNRFLFESDGADHGYDYRAGDIAGELEALGEAYDHEGPLHARPAFTEAVRVAHPE